MDKVELEKKVVALNSVQAWNHNYSLPFGVETCPGKQVSHGKNLIKWQRIQPILEVIGTNNKTVLDVGCNEGFFSIKLADMGAKVLGIDIDEHRIEKAMFVKNVLNNSQVDFSLVDIYSEAFSSLKRFDICLCLGVLHRVPDPYSVILKLTEHTDIIIFEWKALKFGPHDESFAYFSQKGIAGSDFYGTEYWLLSYATVERILQRCGFNHFHRIDDPRQNRAILVTGRISNPLFDQLDFIVHRGRIKSLLSHTKRFLATVAGVITGRVNA